MKAFSLIVGAFILLGGCYDGMEFVLHHNVDSNSVADQAGGQPSGSVEEQVWVDSFVQPESFEKIDVLWVIDRSCSMDIHDSRVTKGVEAMMSAMPSGVNWRIKMITAGSGVMQTTMFPLTRGDTSLDALNMLNDLPYDGGEEGFSALFDYINDDPYGKTWLRNDAALLTVFVSDEEEQGYFTHTSFVSWYDYIRPATFISFIGNVKNEDSICPNYISSHMVGLKYMNAVNLKGGVILDMCEEDWAPGVDEATAKIIPLDFVALTHIPNKGSVRLFVDGILADPSEWSYDSVSNEVLLAQTPQGGSFVEVAYTVKYYNLN